MPSSRWEGVAARAVSSRRARGSPPSSPSRQRRLCFPRLPCVTVREAMLWAWWDAHHPPPVSAAGLLSPGLFQTEKSHERWSVACGVPSTSVSGGAVGRGVGPAPRAGPAGFGTPASTSCLGNKKVSCTFAFCFLFTSLIMSYLNLKLKFLEPNSCSSVVCRSDECPS